MMWVAIADIRQIVSEAGELALRYYGRVTGTVKADLSIASEADAAVEDFLRSSLTALAPRYGYIREETAEARPPPPPARPASRAGPGGPRRAFCNDEPLTPSLSASLEPNTFIFGPTNYQRTFALDFPGRIYCLGAPISQLCLLAKGAVAGPVFH